MISISFPVWWVRSAGLLFILGLSARIPAQGNPTASGGEAVLYSREGTDPAWEELLAAKRFPIGRNSTVGAMGSKIDVDNKRIETEADTRQPIPEGILIHTLCHSAIPRRDFGKWTRWYQEDGHTQIFRLFKGEHNVRNERPDAGRIEAFSRLSWTRGEWHEWQGSYTIVHPHACAIFQVKNTENDWAVMITQSDRGDIALIHRLPKKTVPLAANQTGKSFNLRVRDNGHDYEVFFNGELAGRGSYDRPRGRTAFRWGMYDKTLRHDALLFVTGARFR